MTRRSGAVLVVLAGLGMVAGLGWLNSPPAGAPGGLVTIPPGLSARAIAGELKKSGHVRSRRWWELLARAARADQRLKAGTYRVAPGAPAHRLLRDLIVGRGAMTRFVIPEGFSVRQMGERAEAVALCAAAEFRSAAESWEGFLFPETYFLDPRSGAPPIVAAMRDRFDAVWSEVFADAVAAGRVFPLRSGILPRQPDDQFRWADGRVWTVREAVTLASLVERETRRPEERVLVAAVYHNRLKIRMRLECDPTVQFALGGWKSALTRADLGVDSPYNTYRRYGLPPGPIAAPGRGALAAALDPAPVNFLYFVSDGEGRHRFSSNYQDHLAAVRLLRRTLKVRRSSLN